MVPSACSSSATLTPLPTCLLAKRVHACRRASVMAVLASATPVILSPAIASSVQAAAKAGSWQTLGTHFTQLGDAALGLGGVAIQSSRPGDTASLDAPCLTLQVQYLRQPGGGSFQLTDNGAPSRQRQHLYRRRRSSGHRRRSRHRRVHPAVLLSFEPSSQCTDRHFQHVHGRGCSPKAGHQPLHGAASCPRTSGRWRNSSTSIEHRPSRHIALQLHRRQPSLRAHHAG